MFVPCFLSKIKAFDSTLYNDSANSPKEDNENFDTLKMEYDVEKTKREQSIG